MRNYQLSLTLNYKINLFSAADLSFFKMDKIIFGENKNLLNKIYLSKDRKAFKRDEKVFENLKNNLSLNNNLYLVFLDSTHSEYSFPKVENPKFFPICNNIRQPSFS